MKTILTHGFPGSGLIIRLKLFGEHSVGNLLLTRLDIMKNLANILVVCLVFLIGVLANTHLSPNYPKLNFDFLLDSCGNTTKSKFTHPILHP